MLIVILFIGVFLGLQVKAVSAMTFSQAKRVYYQVAKSSFAGVPKLILNPSNDANAAWTGMYVVVNQGMLNSVRNDSEMAMVFGHELAHYRLGHWGSNWANEFAADRLGFTYSVRAGFSGCKGMLWLLRNGIQSTTHPSGKERYYRLCGGR